MSLSQLPEVLSVVFESLNVDDLLRLWKTGDRHLQLALDHSAWRRVRLYDDCTYPRCQWPTFAVRWSSQICHLEIRTSAPLLDHPATTLACIKALPSTLRSLTLRTPQAEEILVEQDERALSALTALYRSIEPLSTEIPKMTNLAAMFPQLEALQITGDEHVMTDFDLFTLPPQLTQLIWSSNANLSDACLKYLPSSITSLQLGSGVNLDNSSPTASCALPPNLETFIWNRRTYNAWHPTEGQLKALPRTLTRLEIRGIWEFPYSLVSSLPFSLTSLVLGSRPRINWITAPLPAHLTRLELDMDDETPSEKLLAVLPSNLTELELRAAIRAFNDEDVKNLPTTLLKLKLRGASEITRDGISALPPSLTQYIHEGPNSTLSTLEGIWPQRIQVIEVKCNSSPPSENPSALSLPICLAQLSLNQLELHDLPWLPKTLQYLSVGRIEEIMGAELPPQLRTLIVAYSEIILTRQLAKLPRTLTTLCIGAVGRLCSVIIAQCNFPENFAKLSWPFYHDPVTIDDVKSLPQSLTHLELPNVTKFDLTALALLSQKSLKELRLPVAHGLTGEHLKLLPRALEGLQIRLEAGELKDDQVEDLPRSLTSLFLRGSYPDLTEACASLLPRNLKSWDLPSIIAQAPIAARRESNAHQRKRNFDHCSIS